jgi:uncharacterized protein YnzC (UPF0291/DUF896 family)
MVIINWTSWAANVKLVIPRRADLMATGFDFSAFDRATDPLFGLLTPEQTRALVAFRGDEKVTQRVDELAAKCKEGQLTDDERAEYEAYASANHLISLMQAKARRWLAEVSTGSRETESLESEELAAALRLKIKTPPNSVLLKLTNRATVPPDIEDIQEERPW